MAIASDALPLDPEAGQQSTKKLCAEYGERLLYVRYRYDEERRKRAGGNPAIAAQR